MEIACDMTVFDAEERIAHQSVSETVFKQLDSIEASKSGYVINFPDHPGIVALIGTFIEKERRCCPFLNFRLNVETNHQKISLYLNGQNGVKEFLTNELKEFLQ